MSIQKREIRSIERRLWLLSLLISVVAVSLIGLSSRKMLPDYVVPDVSPELLGYVPHVNAALVLIGLFCAITGYRRIKQGKVSSHIKFMATAAVVFFGFLTLYLLRLANLGLTSYAGTSQGYWYVYVPLLSVHMILAIVSIPLVLFCLFTVATFDLSEIESSSHPKVGRVAVPLWSVSFGLGFVVYLLLHYLHP
ncbi:MAG: DUF420 domain-containing protein [Halobacteria archaeon]